MGMAFRYWTLFLLGSLVFGALGEPGPVVAERVEKGSHGILLADEEIHPVMTVRWVSTDGAREISNVMSYGPPMGGVVLMSGADEDGVGGALVDVSSNIRGYLALGDRKSVV